MARETTTRHPTTGEAISETATLLEGGDGRKGFGSHRLHRRPLGCFACALTRPGGEARFAGEALTAYDRNPRTHPEAQVAQIAASIAEFGFASPIVTDGHHTIIAEPERRRSSVGWK
jgi:hypothetical protein